MMRNERSEDSGVSTRFPAHVVFLFLVLVFGCGGDGQPGRSDPLLTDSAGIRLVTSFEPRWRISDISEITPTLGGVGKETGDGDEHPLGDVTQALLLGDGKIIFLDFLSRELKAFEPSTGVDVWGSRGQGPGEFVFPVNLQRLAGDSVQVYDRRQGRVSVFQPDGTLAYEISLLGSGGRPPTSVFRFFDSLLIGLSGSTQDRRIVARTETGEMGITPSAVVIYDLRGQVRDTVSWHPGYADIRIGVSSLMPVFGLSTPFAVTRSGRILLGSGEYPSLQVLDSQGRIREIRRLDLPRKSVHRDYLFAILAADERGMQRMGSDNPILQSEFLPDSQPAFKSIRVFRGDEVWLGSADPFRIPSREWQILSGSGTWLGTLGLPEGSALMDVLGGHVLLRRTDELDVQFLEVYDLGDRLSGR